MIRSTRIPPILNRICDDVVYSALLVTADGELLGASTKRSTSSLVPPAIASAAASGVGDDMDHLGTLIADIAVDYQRLGEEYAGVEQQQQHGGGGGSASSSQQQQQQQQSNQLVRGSSGNSNGGPNNSGNSTSGNGTVAGSGGKSQLQCLLMELELGLVAVSSCGSFDCLVIAIAAPTAPLGLVKAKIQTLALYVQEALSPLAENT